MWRLIYQGSPVISESSLSHQLHLPQVSAAIFSMKLSHLIPRVWERAVSVQGPWDSLFPLSPPLSLSLSLSLFCLFLYFLADALGWRWPNFSLYAHTQTLSRFWDALLHGLVWVTSRKRWQNWTPCSAMESRKAPWSWLHTQPMWECAPPSLPPSLPPSSLSLSLSPSPQSVDHPETGSSLFVFLKKGTTLPQLYPQLPCATQHSHSRFLVRLSLQISTNAFVATQWSYIKTLQHARVYKILAWTRLGLYKVRSSLVIGIIYL